MDTLFVVVSHVSKPVVVEFGRSGVPQSFPKRLRRQLGQRSVVSSLRAMTRRDGRRMRSVYRAVLEDDLHREFCACPGGCEIS